MSSIDDISPPNNIGPISSGVPAGVPEPEGRGLNLQGRQVSSQLDESFKVANRLQKIQKTFPPQPAEDVLYEPLKFQGSFTPTLSMDKEHLRQIETPAIVVLIPKKEEVIDANDPLDGDLDLDALEAQENEIINLRKEGSNIQDEGRDNVNESIDMHNAGVATRNEGIATRNEGVATRNEGVATQNEGIATRNEGVATRNEGVATQNEGVATRNEGVEHLSVSTEFTLEAEEEINDYAQEAYVFATQKAGVVGAQVDKKDYINVAKQVFSGKASEKGSTIFSKQETTELGLEIYERAKDNLCIYKTDLHGNRISLSEEEDKVLRHLFETEFSKHFFERNVFKQIKASQKPEKETSKPTTTPTTVQSLPQRSTKTDKSIAKLDIGVHRHRSRNEIQEEANLIFLRSFRQKLQAEKRLEDDLSKHMIIQLDILRYEIARQRLKADVLEAAVTSDAIARQFLKSS